MDVHLAVSNRKKSANLLDLTGEMLVISLRSLWGQHKQRLLFQLLLCSGLISSYAKRGSFLSKTKGCKTASCFSVMWRNFCCAWQLATFHLSMRLFGPSLSIQYIGLRPCPFRFSYFFMTKRGSTWFDAKGALLALKAQRDLLSGTRITESRQCRQSALIIYLAVSLFLCQRIIMTMHIISINTVLCKRIPSPVRLVLVASSTLQHTAFCYLFLSLFLCNWLSHLVQ